MPYREPARTARHRRALAAVLVVGSAALIGAFGYQSSTATPALTAASDVLVLGDHPGAIGEVDVPMPSTVASPPEPPRTERRSGPPPTAASPIDAPSTPAEPGDRRHASRGQPGEADGAVPAGTTVFDDETPGVARLDPALRDALRRAAADAAGDGIHFVVRSGWRSPEYQDELLRQAVSQYGSVEEAARWVATADTSAHVSGDAVDVGPSAATAWLSGHGAEYGLCQIYRNEPWHYELRPEAVDDGCPAMYADPTYDPRMQGE